MSELPTVISSATVRIMGVDLTVHVLDNGERVIDADCVERFFSALDNLDAPLTEDDVVAAAKVIRGVK